MKRILINATQPEELRVALVNGQSLYDLDIERVGREQKKANIYKGRITRIEPSLEAAFVDYGAERHGFLSLKEIAKEYFKKTPDNKDRRKQNIKDLVSEGQEVLVQIDKEERGTKGAALSTFISLAGCYLVLMPNNPRAGGISRRIEGDERDELKDIIDRLNIPEGMGIIVRTAGVGKSFEELEWDLSVLLHNWDAIKQATDSRSAPCLIHQESDVLIRAIRDHFRKDIGEILIDNPELFERAKDYVKLLRPDAADKVKLYQDTIPLFSRFQIESQIESAFLREIRLPSGGAIVIDHTEALTSIDINSAKATKGGDIEETALSTNLEAAEEIARQFRLRDMGGLIVIDFIDMTPIRNQREVENRLRDSVKLDRARVQVGRISKFGLLEMSRQRIRPSLGDAVQEVCPRCDGQGTIRGVESLSLSIIRLIEEEAMKDNTAEVMAQLPIEVATFILNEKRNSIREVEMRHKVEIVLIPNRYLTTPAYEIKRIRKEDISGDGQHPRSYTLETKTDNHDEFQRRSQQPTEQPAVKQLDTPALSRSSTSAGKGIIKRLWSSLFGSNKAVQIKAVEADQEKDSRKPRGGKSRNQRGQNNRRGRQNQRRQSGNRRGGTNNQNRNNNDRKGGNRERGERGERGQRNQTSAEGRQSSRSSQQKSDDNGPSGAKQHAKRVNEVAQKSAPKPVAEPREKNQPKARTEQPPVENKKREPQVRQETPKAEAEAPRNVAPRPSKKTEVISMPDETPPKYVGPDTSPTSHYLEANHICHPELLERIENEKNQAAARALEVQALAEKAAEDAKVHVAEVVQLEPHLNQATSVEAEVVAPSVEKVSVENTVSDENTDDSTDGGEVQAHTPSDTSEEKKPRRQSRSNLYQRKRRGNRNYKNPVSRRRTQSRSDSAANDGETGTIETDNNASQETVSDEGSK